MKIVECISIFTQAGTTRLIVDLCNELVNTADITLISLFSIEDHRTYLDELSPAVKVISINKKGGYDWFCVQRLYSAIKSENPDVVHLHGNNVFLMATFAMALYRKCKWFYTFHSEAWFETPSRTHQLMYNLIFGTGLCKAISNSQIVRESVYKMYSIDTPVIPNGRNFINVPLEDSRIRDEIESYRKDDQTVILLCVSNLTPVKNHILLCKAVKELVDEHYPVELLLIGREDDTQVANKIRALECDHIHLLGAKNHPVPYMYYADGFCLCSHTESGPLVLIEDFYAGTIPICTPGGELKNKIRDGENGILSEDFSLGSYKNALLRFLNMSLSEKAKMSACAKSESLAYSIQNCATKYYNLMTTS